MSNLLDQLKQFAGNEIISATANSLGESESGISKALGAIFPSLLQGVLHAEPASHNNLSTILRSATNDHNIPGDLLHAMQSKNENHPANGIGSGLLSLLFGNKLSGLSNLISNFSGLKSGSSSSLLQMGAGILASFLGKKMVGDGLNLNGILNWLGENKSSFASALPESFGSFLGFASASDGMAKSTAAAGGALMNDKDNGSGGGSKWILPIILLGLLGAFLWYWLQGRNSSEQAGTTTEQLDAEHASGKDSLSAPAIDSVPPTQGLVKGMVNEAGDWIVQKGAMKMLKLDNGVEIESTEGGFEDLLFNFIKDPSASINQEKGDWFNFEDLLFESGKSRLKPGGEKQLRNMIEILSAYPNVKIKVGGYTDNTGDSIANNKLSEARAKTVYQELLKLGKLPELKRPVDKTQFDDKHPFEGYGSLWPVADNATAEGRAQNRRIAVRVKEK